MLTRIQFVDSHTGGEPTRLVLAGGPDLGSGELSTRRALLQSRFDSFRRTVVTEPRGSEVLVGAMLGPAHDPSCGLAVVFFNNVGTLGMCGHGLIGVMATLRFLGRIEPGPHLVETPAGIVSTEVHADHRVTLDNVRSYRHAKDVSVQIPDGRRFVGDVAYGGNWFYLIKDHRERIEFANIPELERLTLTIMNALEIAGVRGAQGEKIDHVELFADAPGPGVDSKNFVMCPGGAYDRSPCGTGTSAKLACLAADGTLAAGKLWRQSSITGSLFEASYRPVPGGVIPRITGTAFVTAQGDLLIDSNDPFAEGIQ